MVITVLRQRNPRRAARDDGEATRRRLIETSGMLFAEHGYAATTGRMICKRAGVNAAALNYYFGGREGLYKTVLEEVRDRIVDMEQLKNISKINLPARNKLELLIEMFVRHALDQRTWHIRLWARELIEPTAFFTELTHTTGRLKMHLLRTIISEVTRIPENTPELECCILNTVTPCIVLLSLNRELATSMIPVFQYPPDQIAQYMKTFIFAGLDAAAKNYSKKSILQK